MRIEVPAGVLAFLLFAALQGCSPGGQYARPSAGLPAAELPAASPSFTMPAGYIKHVVIVIQENRSFDNIFAGFNGADAPLYGYNRNGVKIPLKEVAFQGADLPHTWGVAINEWDRGKMDGFDQREPGVPSAYSRLKRSLTEPYWTMAHQYVLADHMFPTMFGVSFTAHLDLIASTANLCCGVSEVNWPTERPWGCDAPSGTTTEILDQQRQVHLGGPFPCFKAFRTLADTLDAAGLPWKYYAPRVTGPQKNEGGRLWSAFDAILNVRGGPDWKNVVSPPARILADAASGNLPAVSWVVPDAADSDHPGENSDTGPSWVAAVVDAVGDGPEWSSTAILVVWDDWGGFYDNVPPPVRDFRGNGIRVPFIMISPYAKRAYVSHTNYEFGSVIKFVEETFDLPVLGTLAAGYTDGRANPLVDSFDFTQAPRAFVHIHAPHGAGFFLSRPPSLRAPDDE